MGEKFLQDDPLVVSEILIKKEGRWIVLLKNGRKVYRSRYMMEKKLCCTKYGLPKVFVVHHKNKDTENDNIENLILTTSSLHRKFHYRPSVYGIPKTTLNKYGFAYRKINKEILKEKKKVYEANHRDSINAWHREYKKKNREAYNQRERLRYITKVGGYTKGPYNSNKQIKTIY